ncbi:hypothetical protein BH23ACT9_BH23ACT9_23110 [soil metagenome]
MSAATIAPTKLYRSTRDKKVAGVCGGIAGAMGWDPTAVRLLAALSIPLPGPQVIAYLVAWIVMPTDERVFGWEALHGVGFAGRPVDPPAPPAPSMPSPPSA